MASDDAVQLPPELEAAVTAALDLYPDQFRNRGAVVAEGVARLIDILASDRKHQFAAAGPDYARIQTLVERWLREKDADLGRTMVSSPPIKQWQRFESSGPALSSHRVTGRVKSLSDTALEPPPRGEGTAAVSSDIEVSGDPLFGLHNRDYPSLWAAHRLYAHAADGPVQLTSFLSSVVAEAWEYGRELEKLGADEGLPKLAALFPTNTRRRESAEEGFRNFAIGSVRRVRGSGERRRLSGPLYQWRVAAILPDDSDSLMIGRTVEGEALLNALAGISLELPHNPAHTSAFIEHIRQFAPADWQLLRSVIQACVGRPTRQELMARLQRDHPDWSDAQASTYAVGYIGRAREWGLCHPKLGRDRRYELTDLGREYAESGGGPTET